jgi:threonine/homoserine/homoserine lactone efflux protein
MDTNFLAAFATFAFVSSITPGPNNLMLMASGANFGFRRSVPHLLGVGLGFVAMVFLVGIGLVGVFDRFPVSYDVLKVASVAYLLYLAWKIASAGAPSCAQSAGEPFTFIQAALFQWVNPKAWAMALTSVSVYAPEQSMQAVILVAVIFGMINLPSISSWTVLGQQMQGYLTSQKRLRWFNGLMAALLVSTLYPVLHG